MINAILINSRINLYKEKTMREYEFKLLFKPHSKEELSEIIDPTAISTIGGLALMLW